VATLAWDGQCWAVDERPGAVQVMIDLDRWLLLRWRPGVGRGRWLAMTASEVGPAWPLLRAALHAPQPLVGAKAAPSEHV
jgi:hypothetical protein